MAMTATEVRKQLNLPEVKAVFVRVNIMYDAYASFLVSKDKVRKVLVGTPSDTLVRASRDGGRLYIG